MRTKRSLIISFIILLTALLASPAGTRSVQAQEPPPPLATEEIQIVGMEPRPSPATQVVPRNTGTIVTPLLVRSDELVGGELPALPEDAMYLAELRGPAFGTPVSLSARPNEPFIIPPLPIDGRYTLSNIRLVSGGETLLQADPDTASIEVIERVLVSQVTSRPLTADEIRDRGIIIDQTNFQVVNFTVAFGLENEEIEIEFPMILPNSPTQGLPGVPVFDFPHMAPAAPPEGTLPSLSTIINVPNIQLTGFGLEVPEDEDKPRPLVNAIPGVVIIPGNVAYLNQFFSVILKVSNVAPGYSNLVVRDLEATAILPGGVDSVPGTSDDPLRMARLGDPPAPQSTRQFVTQPGPDGRLGTADDIRTLAPNQSGDAEFLVEGLREGVHRIEIEIKGTLEGLPGGAVPLQGRAVGVVEVRNPTFALTFNHPATITAGEEYDFNVTVTNVSETPANFASLSLLPRSISGAQLLSEEVVQIETIAAGDSATVTFRMRANTTGTITSSSYASDGIPGKFELSVGVGELGIPMSPNVLILPPPANSLPVELRQSAIGLLGQALALARSPTTPTGLLPMGSGTVYDRASDVAAAGQRVGLGESLPAMGRDLALDFMGNNYSRLGERYSAQQVTALARAQQDYRGFDALMRNSSRGQSFLNLIAGFWGDAIASQGVLSFQGDFAEAVVSRPAHLSAVVGSGTGAAPVVLNMTDGSGRHLGIRAAGTEATQAIPFGAFFSLLDEDPNFSQMAMVAVPQNNSHTVEVLGTGSGQFDLGLVVPEGSSLRHVTFTGVPVSAGVRGRVIFTVGSVNSYVLMIDTNGDGTDDQVLPTSSESVVDNGPQIIGAVQIFTGEKDGTKYGQVMGLLFNEEVSRDSAQDRVEPEEIDQYTIGGNVVGGVAVQPGGRVVMLGLRDGIGPFVDRDITVTGITDRHGNAMVDTGPVPITPAPNLPDGGTIQGTVRHADGTAVPFARMNLWQIEMDINDEEYPELVTSKSANADGTFSFDWVRVRNGYFDFMDPQTGERNRAFPLPRYNGHRLEVDLILLGTGTITGRVLAADGVTPLPGAFVQAVNPLKIEEPYQTTADATGRYVLTKVPVGNVSIQAAHVISRSQTVIAATIPAAGETLVQDLILYPVSADYPRGNVQGQVFRSDGITPAVGVPVYSAVGGAVVTDGSGRYRINDLPAGGTMIRALDQERFEVGDVQTTILADRTVTANLVMHGGTGTVEGVVLEADGTPSANIAIYGGPALVRTNTQGQFVLNNVPVGSVRLWAQDDSNPNNIRMVQASTSLTHDGETVEVQIFLPAQGVITGVVRDAGGNPVPNLKMFIYGPENDKTTTNAQGEYRFEHLPMGEYTVAAFYPDFSDGNFRNGRLVFKDQTLRLDVSFRGRGTVRGTVYDDDGVTPLGARVGLSEWIVKIGRLIPIENPLCLPDVYVGEEKVLDLPECEQVPVEWKYQTRSRRINSNVESGEFVFENVFVGDFLAEAANPFSPEEVAVAGEIITPTQTVSVTLSLQSTGVVTGTLYQPDGITPVVGGVVELDAAYISDVRVATDANGVFAFPLVPAGGFSLTAEDSATGLVGGRITGSVQAGQTANLSLRLLREGSVTVTVQGSAGTIEGASVVLREHGYPYRTFQGQTGAEGTLTFSGGNAPVEGGFSVTASHQGISSYTSSQVPSLADSPTGAVEVIVTLGDAVGAVEGRFLRGDGVTPIPNAQISLTGNGRQAFLTTGPDGAYRFEGVRTQPTGSFVLEAFDPTTGRRGRASGVAVTDQTVTVDMVQIAQGTVSGFARWAATGAPVPMAQVRLSSSGVLGGQSLTTAGLNGAFTIPGVSAGNFHISVTDPATGLTATGTGMVIREGEVVAIDINIVVPPVGRVEGHIFDSNGNPSALAAVRLSPDYGTGLATVDDSGFYFFDGVRPGRYTILATVQNSPDRGVGAAEIVAAGEVVTANVNLIGLGRVVGVVQTAGDNPEPVPFVRVNLNRNNQGLPVHFSDDTLAGPDGTFEFDEVLAGTLSLDTVQSATGLAGNATGTLEPGHTLTVTLTLESAASVRGRVLRENGEPAPLMALEARLLSPPRSRFGASSDTVPEVGTFLFEDLKLGSYLLDVSDPLGDGIAIVPFTLDEQGEVVDLGDIVLDSAPPAVAAILPSNGAGMVPVTQTIQVTFSEPVDPTTVNATNLIVSNAQGTVAGSWALDAQGTVATFTRQSGTWRDLEVISIRVRTTVKDRVGRALAAQVISSFTTTDSTAPVISSLSPINGATGVALDAVVRVSYSEVIDIAAFDAVTTAIRLTQNGTPVPGVTAAILNDRVLVFTPNEPLQANATYQVSIEPASDLYGNSQSAITTASFSTIDIQAPVLQSIGVTPSTTVRVGTSATFTAQLDPAPDIAFVEFFVNGASRHIQRSAPYAFVLATTPEMGSQVTVAAAATDLAGNVSVTRSVVLFIQPDIAPQVTITAPQNGVQVRNGERVTVTVQSSDDVGLSRILFQATGAVQSTVTRSVPGLAPTYTTSFFIDIPANAAPGATIELRASAVDTRNQSTEAARINLVVRDTTAPTVQITAPANNSEVEPDSVVNVTVRGSDNGTVGSISLSASGASAFTETRVITPAQSLVDATFEVPVDEDARVSDSLVLTARATDSAGNLSLERVITLRIKDLVAPEVTLTLPDGVTNVARGQTLDVTVSATDESNMVSLGLESSGIVTSTQSQVLTPPRTSGSTTFAVTIPMTATAGSQLTLTGRATDVVGNIGQSVPVTLPLIVDDVPVVTITEPALGSIIGNDDVLTVTVEATDDVGLSQLILQAEGVVAYYDAQLITTTETSTVATFVVDITGARPGDLELRARAIDSRDQASDSESIVVHIEDRVAPTTHIQAPTHGDSVSPGTTFEVRVIASDNDGIGRVMIRTSGAFTVTDFQELVPSQEVATVTFEIEVPADAAANEEVVIEAIAVDASNNPSAADAITLFIHDAAAPDVTIALPDGLTELVIGERFTITVTATDTVGVIALEAGVLGAFEFQDGVYLGQVQGVATAEFGVYVPEYAPAGGEAVIRGRAYDEAGNEGASSAITLPIVLPETYVRGTVTDAAGQPVVGADVYVTAVNGDFQATTGIDGTYEVRGILPGSVDVWAEHPVTGMRAPAYGFLEFGETVLDGMDIAIPDAPEVTITSPITGTTLIENTSVAISATATSELLIQGVQFTIDGLDAHFDSIEPYGFEYDVPEGASSLTFGAVVYDDYGNTGEAQEVVVSVIPDSNTTVEGVVTDESGEPIVGASVTVLGDFPPETGELSEQTGEGGSFSIEDVPTIYGDVQVIARATIGGVPYQGLSELTAPVPGGLTYVGEIAVTLVRVWDGGANTTSWLDAANWSEDSLPTALDDVYIPVTGTVSLNSGTVTVHSITSDGSFTLNGGSLALRAPSTMNGGFTLASGTLEGAGDLLLNGAATWTTGSMLGTGTTVVTDELTINTTSGNWMELGRTLRNDGVINWNNSTGGTSTFYLRNGARLLHQPGATFNVGNNTKQFLHASGGTGAAPLITNAGTLNQAGSNSLILFNSGVDFTNTGSYVLANGEIELKNGGVHSGAFELGDGTTLRVNGGAYTFDNTSSVTGIGTVIFASGTSTIAGEYLIDQTSITGGTANFDSDVSSPSTLFTNGVMGGSGTFTATGPFTWTFGAMIGSGTTVISDVLTINPTNGNYIDLGRTLVNQGTLDWNNSTGGTTYFYLRNGSHLNNTSGATLNVGVNAKHFSHTSGGTGPAPLITNAGAMNQVGANSQVTINSGVDFVNAGGYHIGSGALNLRNGGAHSGSISLEGGTSLEFSTGTYTLNGASSVTGAGTVYFSGATVSLAGTYEVGRTSITSGIVNFDGTVASASTVFTGGTLGGSGTFTATGPFTWTTGVMTGSGTTIVSDTMTMNPASGWGIELGRALINEGTINWTNTTGGTSYFYLRNGSQLINQAGATLNVGQNSKHFSYSSNGTGALPLIGNAGTINQVGSASAVTVNASIGLANSGTYNLTSGVLALNNGGTHSGTFDLSAGTTMLLSSGTYTFDTASEITGAGIVQHGGATSNIEGEYEVGFTSVTGGLVNFNSNISLGSTSFTNGTIGGSGTINVTGPFTWTVGVMAGAGTTVVSDTMTINPPNTWGVELGRALTNAGTINWTNNTGGTTYFYIRNGGVLTNQTGAIVNVGSNNKTFTQTSGGSGALARFDNAGELNVLNGTGQVIIDDDMAFMNTGDVTVQGGTLAAKHGDSHSGSFESRGGATLDFSGGHALNGEVWGVGQVRFSGGTNNVLGSYNVLGSTSVSGGTTNFTGELTDIGDTLSISGNGTTANFSSGETVMPETLTFDVGTLTGSDNIVAADVHWTRGNMMGTGVTTATNTLTLDPPGSWNATLGRTFNNAGAATWTNSTSAVWFYMYHGARFNNLPGATFDVGDNKRFWLQTGASGAAPLFENQGTFRKSVGTGTSYVHSEVSFQNSGTVEVLAGTLEIARGATHTGTFDGAAGGTLDLSGGHTLQGSISSEGTILFSGGTNTVQGAYNVLGTTRVSGGTTNFPAQVTSLGENAAITAGTANFSGPILNIGPTLTVSGGTANFTGQMADTVETLNVSGGTANFSTGTLLTPTTVTLTGGTLTGSDSFEVTNMSWRLGQLERLGTGTPVPATTVLNTLLLNTPASSGSSLALGRTLNLPNGANWTETNSGTLTMNMDRAATINIGAGAVFAANDGKRFVQNATGTGTGPTINNNGIFRKSGAGTFSLTNGIQFHNNGSVEVLAGTLDLGSNGTHSGSLTALEGTVLTFAGTQTFIGNLSSQGTARFTSGTHNIQGVYDVPLGTTVSGGTVNFSGQIPNVGSTLTISGGTTNFTGSLVDNVETVVISGGTVNFSSGTLLTPTTLTLTAGTLTGSDSFEVTNMSWRLGSIERLGTTVPIPSLTVLNTLQLDTPASSGTSLSLERTLNLPNGANWTAPNSGTLTMNLNRAATINNGVGATFNVSGAKRFAHSAAGTGSGSAFNNYGTFTKQGEGTFTFLSNVPFNNFGTVNITGGTLDIDGGGTHSGVFSGLAGTALEFGGGTSTLESTSAISTAGQMSFAGGTANVQGSYDVSGPGTFVTGGTVNFTGHLVNMGDALTVNGSAATANFSSGETVNTSALNLLQGTLTGTDDIEAENMTWSLGSMTGGAGADTTVSTSLTLNTPVSGNVTLVLGRTLNIAGTATWSPTGAASLNVAMGGTLNTLPGASFDIVAPKTFGASATGTGTRLINNQGTFRVAGGTGSVTVNSTVPFQNSGVVHLPAAKLVLNGGFSQLAAGTTVVEMSGPLVGTELHRVEVGGTATLDGALQVVPTGGFVPTTGATFDVLTYTTRGGAFASITGLTDGRQYLPSYQSNLLRVQVAE